MRSDVASAVGTLARLNSTMHRHINDSSFHATMELLKGHVMKLDFNGLQILERHLKVFTSPVAFGLRVRF